MRSIPAGKTEQLGARRQAGRLDGHRPMARRTQKKQ